MSLDRRHLQLLAALADRGQLGEAARALHLSPSAASHRIREAERRLRVPLIAVEGRVARLTPAGRLLAETARVTERQLDRAEQASRWLHHGAGTDRLRIGVGAFDQLRWHRVLFDAATALDVHSVDLVAVPERSELEALDRGDIDLAIIPVAGGTATPGHWAVLAEDRLVAVMPEDPTTHTDEVFWPADVAGCDYLAFSFQPMEGWELYGFLNPEEARPRTLRQVDRLSTLLALIEDGRGVSIQPEQAVSQSTTGRAVSVRPLSVNLPIRWYVAGRNSMEPAMRSARDLLARSASHS